MFNPTLPLPLPIAKGFSPVEVSVFIRAYKKPKQKKFVLVGRKMFIAPACNAFRCAENHNKFRFIVRSRSPPSEFTRGGSRRKNVPLTHWPTRIKIVVIIIVYYRHCTYKTGISASDWKADLPDAPAV